VGALKFPAMSAVPGGERPAARLVNVAIPLRTLVVVLSVLFAAWAFVSISDALLLIFTGVFLAFVFEYPTRLLMRKTRLGRGLAATVVVLGTAVAATALLLVLFVPIASGIRDLLKDVPQLVEDLRASDELSWLAGSGAAENMQTGSQHLADAIPTALGDLVGLAGAAFSFGLAVFTIIFVALFLLIDRTKIQQAIASMLPPQQGQTTIEVWERITTTISRWAIGAATIALIAGTVQGGTAYLLGSSYWLALGLIAGFLDLIPNLGATIAGFILVPTLLAEQGLTAAIIMLIVILVYQQIENNLLTPTIQGKATNIWASLVIISVTIFGALLGVLGALVAVPLTASLQIIIQQITAQRRQHMAALHTPPPATDP
jgi:predicted PurR-regulated permease PerM